MTSPVVSDFYAALHGGNGVDVRFEQVVTELVGRDGHVAGVRLADGETIRADVVVVGIGLVPNTGPIGAAGALVSNGVHVDALCRTSLQDVFAIGDVALQANDFAEGQAVRIESVPDTVLQAKTVANHLLGLSLPKQAAPWFSSKSDEAGTVTALRCKGCSFGLERLTQPREFAEAIERDGAHGDAASHMRGNETLRGEPSQRLAQGRARHTRTLGRLDLAVDRSGRRRHSTVSSRSSAQARPLALTAFGGCSRVIEGICIHS